MRVLQCTTKPGGWRVSEQIVDVTANEQTIAYEGGALLEGVGEIVAK